MRENGGKIKQREKEYISVIWGLFTKETGKTISRYLTYIFGWKFPSLSPQDGYGVEAWPDGTRYEGHFCQGKRSG